MPMGIKIRENNKTAKSNLYLPVRQAITAVDSGFLCLNKNGGKAPISYIWLEDIFLIIHQALLPNLLSKYPKSQYTPYMLLRIYHLQQDH